MLGYRIDDASSPSDIPAQLLHRASCTNPRGGAARCRSCLKGAARLRPVRAVGALLLIVQLTSEVEPRRAPPSASEEQSLIRRAASTCSSKRRCAWRRRGLLVVPLSR